MTWKDLLVSAKPPPEVSSNRASLEKGPTPTVSASAPPSKASPKPSTSDFVLPKVRSPSPSFHSRSETPPPSRNNGFPSPRGTRKNTASDASPGWVTSEKSDPNEQPVACSPVKKSRSGAHNNNRAAAKDHKLTVNGARLQYSKHFVEGIALIERERKMDLSLRYIQSKPKIAKDSSIKVFIRKRPITRLETDIGDFDVVRTESQSPTSSTATGVVVYNTLLTPDQTEKIVKPAIYGGDACFDETIGLSEVYQACGKPLVETVKSGGMATLLVFGQSGTGKAYTMNAMEELLVMDIFDGLPMHYLVKVSAVVLGGQNSRDLMDDALTTVRIVDYNDGSVHFVNSLFVTVSSPEELIGAMSAAKRRLNSPRAKDFMKNDFSCHVIYRIGVVPPQDAPECVRQGTLSMIHCEGTEKRPENQYADTSEINVSAWALKKCLRAKVSCETDDGNEPPYDYSTLTRILRSALESNDVALHILATISPKATDTESTLETLSSVSPLVGGFAEVICSNDPQSKTQTADSSSEELVYPKAWNHDALSEWLTRKHLICDDVSRVVPGNMNGRQIMKMTKSQLQQTFFFKDSNDGSMKKADLLYRCLRAENDRVARLKLKRQMAAKKSH